MDQNFGEAEENSSLRSKYIATKAKLFFSDKNNG